MKPSLLFAANPHAHYLAHQAEIDAAIQRVLASGRYILGDEVAAFEREFAAYLGVRQVVGVASGTDAIQLALLAAGIGRGDQVITPAHTAVATIAAIELAGAEPLLVDIDPATFTLDPVAVQQAITPRVKAIVAVHLYGRPCDLSRLAELVQQNDLQLIEDCAQSHGATHQGRKTGAFGRLAAFSFYPTKNLGALGDGGAVATNDEVLAARLRQLREYGWRERYVSEIAGLNSRLDEIQAAVLRVNLNYLEAGNQRRRGIARQYTAALGQTGLTLPEEIDGHVFHQYVIRSTRRDALRQHLQSEEIQTLIHYPVPVHWQPAYRDHLALGPSGLSHTETACREILSLPMHPSLTDQQVERVIKSIKSAD